MAKPKVREKFGMWEWHGEAEKKATSTWQKKPDGTKYAISKLFYKVTCTCGSEKTKWVLEWTLKKGESKSCGCLQKLAASKRAIDKKIKNGPGKKDHPLYEIWNGMHQRCYNENATHYNRYGGRGIIIYDEWKRPNPEGLNNFANYMGERPDNTTLDRMDNDGNYEPGNVRWATHQMQADNRIIYPHCRITDLKKKPLQNFGKWLFLGIIERRYIDEQPSARFYKVLCTLCQTENWVRKQDLINNKSSQCKSCYQNRGRLL